MQTQQKTFDETIVDSSAQQLLVTMILSFILSGAVEFFHYSFDIFKTVPTGFNYALGASGAILLQLTRFSLAMSSAKNFQNGGNLAAWFGLAGSAILTIMGLYEAVSLGDIWGGKDVILCNAITTFAMTVTGLGMFLEVRYAMLYKSMHKTKVATHTQTTATASPTPQVQPQGQSDFSAEYRDANIGFQQSVPELRLVDDIINDPFATVEEVNKAIGRFRTARSRETDSDKKERLGRTILALQSKINSIPVNN